MSATTSLADTYQSSNYQQGRLLLLNAGQRFWSPSEQTSVLNAAAWLVFSARLSERIMLLHWLWIQEQIRLRLCVLTFRSLNGTAPSYLADSMCRVADVEGRCHLYTSATATLTVLPVRRSTLGDRSFSVAAPRAVNSLLSAVLAASLLTIFWRELKTFLYYSSFLDH